MVHAAQEDAQKSQNLLYHILKERALNKPLPDFPHNRLTGLHQERAYTYSGISCLECVHQFFCCLLMHNMHFCLNEHEFSTNCNLHTKFIICMSKQQKKWCTHSGQEIPEWVYAPSWCKPVDSAGSVETLPTCPYQGRQCMEGVIPLKVEQPLFAKMSTCHYMQGLHFYGWYCAKLVL